MAYNTPVFQGWRGYFQVLGILSGMAHAWPFCEYLLPLTMHLFDLLFPFLLDSQWHSGGVQGFGWSYRLSMEQGYMSSIGHTCRCSFHYPSIKEELATEKDDKTYPPRVSSSSSIRLRRIEWLSHVGFLFWMPQPHGCAIIGVGHEKMQ